MKVVECKDCGFAFTNPRLPISLLNKLYIEWTPTGMAELGWREKKKIFYKVQYRIEKLKRFKKSGTLLEVGFGHGVFLEEAYDTYDCYGVDLCPYFVHYFTRVLKKKNIRCGSLKSVSFPHNFFDIVVLWDVLEHIPDPMATLREVSRVIKEDGVLALRVPNAHYYNFTPVMRFLRSSVHLLLAKDMKVAVATADHVNHFTPKILIRVLKDVGFTYIEGTPTSESWNRDDRIYRGLHEKIHLFAYKALPFWHYSKIANTVQIVIYASKKPSGN